MGPERKMNKNVWMHFKTTMLNILSQYVFILQNYDYELDSILFVTVFFIAARSRLFSDIFLTVQEIALKVLKCMLILPFGRKLIPNIIMNVFKFNFFIYLGSIY